VVQVAGARSRSREPGFDRPQPNTLVYYEFDNWGRPIAEPFELLPNSHWIDYPPGVLIDRLDRIHVVWLRQFDDSPQIKQLIYIRLSTEGEFLQEPLVFQSTGGDPNGFAEGKYHLIETSSGEIWASCGNHFFAIDVNGNLVESPQSIYPIPQWAEWPLIAAAPDGAVWATFRKTTGTSVDSMKTVRLWPPPRIEETTFVSDNAGFSPHAFTIDSFGSFHYVIFSEDSGFFYRFDPRGQGQVVSFVFDSFPSGVGWSDLGLIGEDSLQYIWGESLPSVGISRICFTVGGEVGLGPIFIPQEHFGITDYNTIWRDGGYWVPGGGIDGACAMLHIPGPEEPLGISETPASQPARASLQIYPQPSFGTLNFVLPSTLKGEINLIIYNLLGQQVYQLNVHEPFGLPGILLPPGLATGTYVLSLTTPNQFLTSRFLLIR